MGGVFLYCSHLLLSLNLELSRLDWLTSKTQGSTCLSTLAVVINRHTSLNLAFYVCARDPNSDSGVKQASTTYGAIYLTLYSLF